MSEASDYWTGRLAATVPPAEVHREVEQAVRTLMADNLRFSQMESHTAEVVDGLFPAADVRTPQDAYSHKALYRALAWLATRGLKDCCYKGPPRTSKKLGTIRPWMWHPPRVATCPHCGGVL